LFRWEEEKHPEGVKWLTLEHKGPYFPPEYEPLPDNVKFYYDGTMKKSVFIIIISCQNPENIFHFFSGEQVKLSVKSEEVSSLLTNVG
jgi:hypothetical protein